MRFGHWKRRTDPVWASVILGLLAGGLLILLLWSDSGAAGDQGGARETFTLRITEIVDAHGVPVPAAVLLDGQVLADGVTSFTREVPLVDVGPDPLCLARHGGDAAACPGTRVLEVRARGYQPWELRFRANLAPGRELGGPVRLRAR